MEPDKRTDHNIYFAPMEGITGHVYRSAHAHHFSGIDRYYLPFIAAHATHTMKNKEKKDVSPAQNVGLCAIPQVLTKNTDDFLWTVDELTALGYREINLNFGCPSPTVTSKGKGAAFLGEPDELDRFLESIFEDLQRHGLLAAERTEVGDDRERDASERAEVGDSSERNASERTEIGDGGNRNMHADKGGLRVSVKTRLGVERTDEWERIFSIFNRYPISELIVHARTMREFYNGDTHIDTFGEILGRSRIPVCYNGNINTAEQYRSILGRFGDDPHFTGVMIGRGLIANPALVREIRGGDSLDAATLRAFHDDVLGGYLEELSGDTHVISKMKELWWYMGTMFLNAEKPLKRLRKSKTVREYKAAVCEVLRCEIRR